MAINPRDATIAVFVGTNLFRLVSMSENVWRQYGFQKAQNFSILSVCWLTDDRVLAGCKGGKVLIIQSGDLNGIYDINNVDDIQIIAMCDSKKDQLRTLSRTFSKQMSVKHLPERRDTNNIRCCTAIRTGFLYSRKPGEVIYFEKTGKTSYRKSTTFVIEQDIKSSDVDYDSLYAINSIGISIDNNIVSCTTNRFQIYWASLRGHKTNRVQFQVFEEPLHHGSIAGLSTCLWKPIFMTYGQLDNSVRIWNYLTKKLLLNQTFVERVTSISLHPTGLYALIGFSDKVKYFLVLIHTLQAYREFGIAQCRLLSFSNNGHLFAAECECDILIYSSITFHKVACFKGHYQVITSLQWSYNDMILYSSSVNGAVYEWSIEKNSRISDVVLQDMIVKGLVVSPDDKVICVAADGRIIEIEDNKVITSQRLHHEHATNFNGIILMKNGFCKLMLACSNGMIIALNYPIREEECKFDTFSMHNCPLTEFHALRRGRSFVSADIDGNICIWDVKMTIDDERPCEPFFDEILVNMDELHEKNQNVEHLTSRIAEMTAEHSFEILQKDNFYTDRIIEIEQNNAHQILTLRKRIKSMEKEHSMELNRIHLNITQMKQQHTSQIDQIESHFNAKLLYEFQKYDDLRQEMEKTKDEYKKQLECLKKTRDSEHEVHKLKSQNDYGNLQRKLIQSQNTLASEKRNFEETLSEIKEKHKQNEDRLKTSFENTINQKDTTTVALRTELGITKKKLTMLKREKEELKSVKSTYEQENENLKHKLDEYITRISTTKNEMNALQQQLREERASKAKLEDKIGVNSDSIRNLKNETIKLKMLLQEKHDQLITKEDEICALKGKVKTEDRESTQLKAEILQLNSRLRGKEKVISNTRNEILHSKDRIAHLKRDISMLKDSVQDADNLKKQVKELYKKYVG